MRQLTFVKPGTFELRDVPAPQIKSATDAIVKPIAVARCDLDLYIATGFVTYPGGAFAFGHECVGEVVDAGDKSGVRPGERVVVPFQLSCGRCATCKRGHMNTCEAYPFRAAYGLKPMSGTEFGGALSDLMYVPFADHMLVRVPQGLDPVSIASTADNAPDGWRAVADHLKARPGASVLVVGGAAQSVSLYAAAAAKALGAGRVVYLDDDAVRRATAQRFGITVEALQLKDRRETAKAKRGLGRGASTEQFDITVDGSGDPDALDFVIASTAPNGVCTIIAIYFTPTTPIPLSKLYSKGITIITGRVEARGHLPDVLESCAHGHFHPEHVTSRVVPFSEAAEAMTDPSPKLIFTNDWT
ncbi:MAG: alcohol dehydrogenase catalytic domain-containing protein [Alphaproteobacteria bacterium]|nr:alcohol dehydrogenase catalytic domain-containing protein [Alphaproteobacteria bacterium]